MTRWRADELSSFLYAVINQTDRSGKGVATLRLVAMVKPLQQSKSLGS